MWYNMDMKKVKENSKADKIMDKKLGVKEGSARDRKMDKPVGSVQKAKAAMGTPEMKLMRAMKGAKK